MDPAAEIEDLLKPAPQQSLGGLLAARTVVAIANNLAIQFEIGHVADQDFSERNVEGAIDSAMLELEGLAHVNELDVAAGETFPGLGRAQLMDYRGITGSTKWPHDQAP
jgi:hypothetical protein